MHVVMIKGQKLNRGRCSTIQYKAGLKYDVPEDLAVEWINAGIAKDPTGRIKKPEPPQEEEGAPAGGEG